MPNSAEVAERSQISSSFVEPVLDFQKDIHRYDEASISSVECLSPSSTDPPENFFRTKSEDHFVDISDSVHVVIDSFLTENTSFSPAICPKSRKLALDVKNGVDAGMKAEEIEDGVSGAFYLKSEEEKIVGIFKPEEVLSRRNSYASAISFKNFRKGIRNSETPVREVAAYLLDRDSFVGVPETLMVSLDWNLCRPLKSRSAICCGRSCKTGSLQRYKEHDDAVCNISTSKLSVEHVHKLGVFDIRLMNTDRHEANILVRFEREGDFKSPVSELIPIDHGLALPNVEEINVEGNFCWMGWKQSKQKFSEEVKTYIRELDAKQDCQLLVKSFGGRIPKDALLSLEVGTMLLKIGVLDFDLTLFELGCFITGETQQNNEEFISPLKQLLAEVLSETSLSFQESLREKLFERLKMFSEP